MKLYQGSGAGNTGFALRFASPVRRVAFLSLCHLAYVLPLNMPPTLRIEMRTTSLNRKGSARLRQHRGGANETMRWPNH
jgi:hypothetical protein